MFAYQPGIPPTAATRLPPVSSWVPNLWGVETIRLFAAQVIGRADLSRAASEVAVERATRADVKEFAADALVEARTVIAALEELGTPLPAMGPDFKASLGEIASAPAGKAFDTAYISAEYENRAFLRDLAAAYLRNSQEGHFCASEHRGRQLAGVVLLAFAEHTEIIHQIPQELAA